VIRETHKIFVIVYPRDRHLYVSVAASTQASHQLRVARGPSLRHRSVEMLETAPGVKMSTTPAHYFPMPRDASGPGTHPRGRRPGNISDPSGRSIALFVAGDNSSRPQSLQRVQIAEVAAEVSANPEMSERVPAGGAADAVNSYNRFLQPGVQAFPSTSAGRAGLCPPGKSA